MVLFGDACGDDGNWDDGNGAFLFIGVPGVPGIFFIFFLWAGRR